MTALVSLGLTAGLAALFAPDAAAIARPAGRAAVESAQPSGAAKTSSGRDVATRSDKALQKLDPPLRKAYRRHDASTVAVFASVAGDPHGVAAQLDGSHTARTGALSLVVGRVPAAQLAKVAGAAGVLSVRQVTFERDGTPVGDPSADEVHPRRPSSGAANAAAVRATQTDDVPYAGAPPPRGSTFNRFRKLNVLDARTHNFTGAWRAGLTGEGSTVAVLDSGTDWSHPDLLGAKVASRADGWPAAFDPFGTLQWLAAPGQVDQGLSWYVRTTPVACTTTDGTAQVDFATRTGPSRNLDNPAGTATHSYSFPSSWSKSGTVRLGSHPDDYALDFYGERPAFLVTDPHTAGVYDTIYVDLDDDHSFADEKPVTRASPRSWRDLDGDGYVDLSGGMAYYISDGTGADGTSVPGGLEDFEMVVKGEPGEIVAWTGDFDPPLGGHGTLTASNVVGQGVADGNLPRFRDIPGGTYPAAVVGGAPKATMVPFGDIYFGFDFSTQFSYLLTNEHGVDVSSNSYGKSDVDNDGLDAASQEADIWHTALGGRTTPIFSTGNGAPGMGTVTPPSPVTGIKVGASTQYGATGWDSITRYRQVNDNDVANWSNRGPGATGTTGVDLVADGAYSSGDVNLGRALAEGRDGQDAWETWGGTSRSTPVAAGAAALVYQAYRATHRELPAGFNRRVKTFLKSGATDLGYDSYIQGAGSLNAGRSARLAMGSRAPTPGVSVSPNEWRPGSYRGVEYQAFPHLVAPGQSTSQRFALSGRGRYSVSDRVLRRTAVRSFDLTTSDVSEETPALFNAPNYLVNLTRLVRQHRSADLMVIRASYPYSQFDPDDDYNADQQWRMVTYDWTDQNHDGRLWRDEDHDGTVDNTPSARTNIDGNPIPNFARSEVERGEYERFTYINQETNAYTNMVRSPARRMDSGLFLGFYHNEVSQEISRTRFHVTVEFYKSQDWSWVRTPRSAHGSFTAHLTVPEHTPYGMYDGAVVVSGHGQKSVVPVSVTVAARARQDADGQLTETLSFGGRAVDLAQRDRIYDNGSVFDAKAWDWRAESGDWRFFYFDIPTTPPAGTKLLAQTDFAGPSPHNDLDTLVFGPTVNTYQLAAGSDPVFAPYALGTVGASQNTNIGAGVWRFDTATGTSQELVSAPAAAGLHALVEHEVNFQHDRGEVHLPFQATVGSATVSPDSVDVTTATGTGSFDVRFRTGIDLPGLTADAFGLSQPETATETAHQDDPDDPATASVKKNFTVSHAARLKVTTRLPNDDLDLYLLRDANDDGAFAPDEIVAASAGATGDESIEITRPLDGSYQVWVHGFSVAGTPTFPLTIDVVAGNDLTITGVPTGPVPAGTELTLHVAYAKSMTPGEDYHGELQLGPPSSPALLSVPVVVRRE